MLRVLLISPQPQGGEIRAALAAVTEPHLEIREAQAGAPLQRSNDGADVVMFVFDREHKAQTFPAVIGVRDGVPPVRIALMHERSSHAIREALRAGADEVLFLPLDQGDLARALLKISETRKPQEPALKGKLISLVSVSGGAGVTTIAANCALALARSMGKKVALVDLDFQSGDLAVALNVEPEHSILDLSKPGERLNSVQIESALCKHPSGVYLLAAPKRIEESEQVPAAQVGAVVDLMRQMVDVVIVDIGRHINDASVVVWERSDELFYVIDQSISAMRGAWRFMDLFGRLNIAGLQPHFVLNRWTPRHPIGEKHIINTLGRPLAGHIPRDDANLAHASARGEDLWKVAPRSPLTHSFEALAHRISDLDHGHGKRAGLWSKIFARNGAHPRS
jgi:pilus assembly protein CpaE